MADSVISVQYLKDFVCSQINDDEKWAFNKKLLRAMGLFAGSIVLMRNYGNVHAKPKAFSLIARVESIYKRAARVNSRTTLM
ncbi:hypothetical protein Ahy_B01g056637 [Arachis hypogaea]|uniref:Uncharacterized protein n=1 Tax=Arachis hypogaea TaxID=3818 RepID=A0A445AZE1_ARAHY|nr:hypothetical protein Ahy_B01g056637 [Arachis hypogaea]